MFRRRNAGSRGRRLGEAASRRRGWRVSGFRVSVQAAEDQALLPPAGEWPHVLSGVRTKWLLTLTATYSDATWTSALIFFLSSGVRRSPLLLVLDSFGRVLFGGGHHRRSTNCAVPEPTPPPPHPPAHLFLPVRVKSPDVYVCCRVVVVSLRRQKCIGYAIVERVRSDWLRGFRFSLTIIIFQRFVHILYCTIRV